MAEYHAPLDDIRFLINEVLDADRIRALPGYEDFDADTQDAILEEAARFAAQELTPLNASGDKEGAHWHADGVTSAAGFADVYARFVEAGWGSITGDPEHGGMGMPQVLGAACVEMWNASNLSFALCPLLSAGAVELLSAVGSDVQKQTYLPNMVSGQWSGTMDLTEPQAGSDLGAIRTRAETEGDHYRLFGSKIFITWGEHDMAENTIHMVLARLPDAPEGVRGISLFLVPKYRVNDDGSVGERNDMHCASIEHKLGIHASPTCTMSYGDNGDGAVAYLVGEPHRGLSYMFIMMNQARHKVGIQGLSVADAARQHALAYARERVQGKPMAADAPQGAGIVYHPDVRRMLLHMRAQIDVMRALAYDAGAQMDFATHAPDEATRQTAQARVDLLIPVTKGWLTEACNELTSMAIQVHGGMGFIEETGAAQFLRDGRITGIYEGTNGIQANDLVGRKLLQDGGAAMSALIEDMRATCATLGDHEEFAAAGTQLEVAVSRLQESTRYILELGSGDNPAAAMANAFNYMLQTGYVLGGWYAGRIALAAKRSDDAASTPRIARARFYNAQILPRADACACAVLAGPDAILAPDVESAL